MKQMTHDKQKWKKKEKKEAVDTLKGLSYKFHLFIFS